MCSIFSSKLESSDLSLYLQEPVPYYVRIPHPRPGAETIIELLAYVVRSLQFPTSFCLVGFVLFCFLRQGFSAWLSCTLL